MPTPAVPPLHDLVESYGTLILGAAVGLLITSGMEPQRVRDEVDLAIRAVASAMADPSRTKRLADVLASTAMDLLAD